MNRIVKPGIRALCAAAMLFAWGCTCCAPTKPSPACDPATTVKVAGGLLTGCFNADSSVRVYKGIPYAAPPTGELRWKPPQPAPPWEGIKEATTFGPPAMQKTLNPVLDGLIRRLLGVTSDDTPEYVPECSEDCLYLNVWGPATGENHPVLVWIHGGSLTSGSGAERMFNGEAAARAGVVMVTFNYRLGVFGYLSHPELSAETNYGGSGNYGLMDQAAAIRWVASNIRAFGGNPDRITIAGESAGAFSVSALCASPEVRGLFSQAISQSGTLAVKDTPTGLLSLDAAEQRGSDFLAQVGAEDIEELRRMPAGQLNDAAFEPQMTVDSYMLPDSAYNIFREGKQNPVSLLVGYNSNEGAMFTPFIPMDLQKYKEALAAYGDEKGKRLSQLYPANNDDEARRQFNSLFGGFIFGYPAYSWARIQTQTSEKPVYRYDFSFGPEGDLCGVHAAEVPYAFYNPNSSFFKWTQADSAFSRKMFAYWMNFVKTGDPNGKELPEWKPCDKTNNQVLELGKDIRMRPDPNQALYDILLEK